MATSRIDRALAAQHVKTLTISSNVNNPNFYTEDEVRDLARKMLNFVDESNAKCGVGQLTTFNQLGFKGIPDKPDGWYLPSNTSEVAIILETKNSNIDIAKDAAIAELFKNIEIAKTKYAKVIGILYNGVDVLVFKDKHVIDLKNQLFTKEYYLKLYSKDTIDKELIYVLTQRINNNLHTNFGIKNLYHRMIFTACALVAQRYKAKCLIKGNDWSTLRASIKSTIEKSYSDARQQNLKLDLIADQFSAIQCDLTENQEAIDAFIEDINSISVSMNSDYWNGEDVMAIFFNEFTRYKGKSEQGQVFTPDHITSLIYRITGTSHKDNVLDACCGSGSFLVKAMSYMIGEVGGLNNVIETKKIKEEKLFGVEFSKELFALACANMLIHKDGKTNLIQDDSRGIQVCNWIKQKKITKVLMNPPYETKYGCLTIVKNVLNNVESGAICAFILPDNKLTTDQGFAKSVLTKHTLQKIIKLPDIFSGMAGVLTSIFIFKAHEPQGNKEIFACWIKDDGFETVKNKGRMDTKGKWNDVENKWVEIIYKQIGDASIQWIKPTESLNYKVPSIRKPLFECNFRKTLLKYHLFKHSNTLSNLIFKEECGEILSNSIELLTYVNEDKLNLVNSANWKEYKVQEQFDVAKGVRHNKQDRIEGTIPFLTACSTNNGVACHIDNSNFNMTLQQNAITIDMFHNVFYQEAGFLCDDNVHIFKPKNTQLTPNIGLFIATVLSHDGDDFSYGKQFRLKHASEKNVLLPSILNPDGSYSPDWNYMDSFIESLRIKLLAAISV